MDLLTLNLFASSFHWYILKLTPRLIAPKRNFEIVLFLLFPLHLLNKAIFYSLYVFSG